jgi:hypothetical protein
MDINANGQVFGLILKKKKIDLLKILQFTFEVLAKLNSILYVSAKMMLPIVFFPILYLLLISLYEIEKHVNFVHWWRHFLLKHSDTI